MQIQFKNYLLKKKKKEGGNTTLNVSKKQTFLDDLMKCIYMDCSILLVSLIPGLMIF